MKIWSISCSTGCLQSGHCFKLVQFFSEQMHKCLHGINNAFLGLSRHTTHKVASSSSSSSSTCPRSILALSAVHQSINNIDNCSSRMTLLPQLFNQSVVKNIVVVAVAVSNRGGHNWLWHSQTVSGLFRFRAMLVARHFAVYASKSLLHQAKQKL